MEKKKSKNESVEMNDIKKLSIIVGVIVVAFGLVYGLTVGATKLGLFEPHYTKPEAADAVISYEKINAGTILNRSDSEYYVVIADFSDNKNVYIESLISSYKQKETKLPIYIVDLSDGLNKSIVGENDNIGASTVSEMSVKSETLLKVSNKKITKYLVKLEDIESELK